MRKVGIWLGALLCAGLILLVVLKWDSSAPKPEPAANAVPPALASARTINWTNATARFPAASIVEERQSFDGATQEKTVVEVVKTRSKYPHIRVETRFSFDAQAQAWTPKRPTEYVADQILVQVKPGVTEKQLASALEKIEGRVIQKHVVGAATLVLVGLPRPTIEAVPNALSGLARFPEVFDIAEPHLIRRASREPNDPRYSEQWALQNIQAPSAWDIQRGNSTVVVAVTDSGIDYNHPDLAPRVWANPNDWAGNFFDDDQNGYVDDHRGYNFAYGNNNPYDDLPQGHGTFISGIIGAAGNNGLGMAGVCWNVRIMPVKVMDSDGLLYTFDEILGFDYARLEGAKIVNASFGGDFFSQSEYNAIARLRTAGVLLIAAAGNEGRNNDVNVNYPSSYALDNIVAVTYSDVNDNFSPNANYGATTVDLAAPGVDLLSTSPGGSYRNGSGSSFSTPYVAGVAALLRAQNSGWNHVQVKSAILNNVDRFPHMNGRLVSRGRLNAYEAIIPRIPLAEALDGGGLVWQTGGNRAWFGYRHISADGVDSARCGNITHNESSWVQTSVTGPGRLIFNWKVSCEYGDVQYYDYFQFAVDGQIQAIIDGEYDWEERAYNIPAGTHTLRWTYLKDSSFSDGNDKAWLDQVSFVRDTAGPVITITAPIGTNLYAQDVLLQGTASDISGVAYMEFRVINSGGVGPWIGVNTSDGYATWEAQLSGLALGTNLVRLRAIDGLSRTSSVNRSYMVLSPLVASVSGCGTLSPNWAGTTWHQAGKSLSLRAVPCAGHLFWNWSGDVSSLSPLLTVVMQPTLSVQANFVPNPFTGVAGLYNGLFHEAGGVLHESSGFFKMTLTTTGAFTGYVALGGATNSFTNRFDPVSGQRTLLIIRPGKSPLNVALQVDLAGGTDQVTGQITDGAWTADLVADRLVFNPTNNPPPFAGMYTLVFPGSQDFTVSPSGHGFATATVNTGGRVSIDGRLNDNARIVQTIPVSKNGDWPFYVTLYAGSKGSALGWLKFLSPPGFTNQLLSWIRPSNPAALYYANGFSNELSVVGSPYQISTNNRIIDCTNALLTLSGADFASPLMNGMVLTSSNTVVNGGPHNVSMTIVRTNGTFSGKVIFPMRTNTFQGVFLQQQNVGLGYYVGSNYIGEVRFEPVDSVP